MLLYVCIRRELNHCGDQGDKGVKSPWGDFLGHAISPQHATMLLRRSRLAFAPTLVSLPTAILLAFLGGSKLVSASDTGFARLEVVIGIAELLCAVQVALLPKSPITQFALLAIASLFLGASLLGFATNSPCGCFGSIEATPLDRLLASAVLLTAALLLLKPVVRLRATLLTFLGFGITGAAGEMVRESRAAPEREITNILPAELQDGEWNVTLVRATCPACYDHLRRRRESTPGSHHGKTALVVLGPRRPWLAEFNAGFDINLSVRDPHTLRIRTPQDIVVRYGQLVTPKSHAQ